MEHKVQAMGTRFLIVGSQRSGTTLLGMALQAHPDIELIEENNKKFHMLDGVTKQINLLALDQYRPGATTHIGYKAPRDSHRVAMIALRVPDLRFIWMIRDIFQVVASMMSLKMGLTEPWAMIYAPKEIIKYLYVERDDKQIIDEYLWATSINDTRMRTVALAAVCWLVKRRSEISATTKWPERNYSVNYTDMVTSPEDTLKKILAFLDIPWDPMVLDHSKVLSGGRPGASSTSRSIDTKSLSKWQEVLSSSEVELLTALLQRHNNWIASADALNTHVV